MKKIRMIEIDGCDAVGKTTQLNELKKEIKLKGFNIYETRLLGGDKNCEYQNAFRTILLHDKFPKDSVELEEMMFAETDLAGIKDVFEHLNKDSNIFCTKDRALASHVVYALAKGMSIDQVAKVHHEVIRQEQLLNREFGSVHIILIPDSVEWLMKRLQNRFVNEGVEIVERLESVAVQERVVAGLKMFKDMQFANGLNIEIIEIAEKDTILDVKSKIMKVINSKYTF